MDVLHLFNLTEVAGIINDTDRNKQREVQYDDLAAHSLALWVFWSLSSTIRM